MPLGIYISIPFCRTKCSYCNFASDVFSTAVFERYIERICGDIANASCLATEMGGEIDRSVDSIYLGGGTPTVLAPAQLERMFAAVRSTFDVNPASEITVECAPGTLTAATLETLLRCGVNRVSLGVQSFVDREASAVGRLHNRPTVLAEIARLRAAGIRNMNVDLIAGLPHQTAESWEFSLAEAIAASVPHVSVYMLEVDDESRLGRELQAGGARYHAHFVPDENAVADFYLAAVELLHGADIVQYEISNFAKVGFESSHNLKYWTRQPYFGFGVDAHSMLLSRSPELMAVRFATADSLEAYLHGTQPKRTPVSRTAALEESFFLGLRLNKGLDLGALAASFGLDRVEAARQSIAELEGEELIARHGDSICLTGRGRLLSNEVFERFLETAAVLS